MYILYISAAFIILLINLQCSENVSENNTINIYFNNATLTGSSLNDSFSSNSTNRRQYMQPYRGDSYDPNWGYEPYWLHGDYYFNITNTTFINPKLNISTLCGRECPFMFKLYGIFCARNANMTHRTFNNYCDLVNIDCNNRMKWTIIYRGQCHTDLVTYRLWQDSFPLAGQKLISRAVHYVDTFEKTYTTVKKKIDYKNRLQRIHTAQLESLLNAKS